MKRKAVSVLILTLLLSVTSTLTFNIQPAKASGTIYIRADGSVEGTDKIQRDGNIYNFTDNIYDGIVVERGNITIDGNGYKLQGTGDVNGFFLSRIDGVTILNTNIDDFSSGVKLYESSSNTVSCNNVTNSYYGISLPWSSDNIISGNKIAANTYSGIELWASSDNIISGNIITDNGDGATLSSSSNNNTIFGNNITNNWDCGVYLGSSSSNNIARNNMITDNECGIRLSGSSHTTISSNDLTSNDKGIYLEDSATNIIYGNSIKNARYGILSDTSDDNIFSENNITNNRSYGIEESYGVWLFDSSNNTLFGNMLNGCKYNFYVTGFSVIQHMHSIDVSNLVDGKPVYYLVNQKDVVINPSTCPEIGYLAVINSTNIMVEGLTLMNSGQGLLLAYIENSRITHNYITNNIYGVYLRGCSNNTIFGNNIRNNSEGVYLRKHPFSSDKSSNNTISQNNITSNWLGVEISSSSYNNISRNNITGNSGGILIGYWSSNNMIFRNNIVDNRVGLVFSGHTSSHIIFHNNLVNNTDQVSVLGEHSNVWNNGYPSGGNYWSDYEERYPFAADEYQGENQDIPGSDGIWDHPYEIDANNIDKYPLAEPWSPVEVISATIDIDPDTLNMKSKGKWITAYIELPEGYNVGDIDVSTILLNSAILTEMHPTGIGDEDSDGIPDFMVKFDRASVISYIYNVLEVKMGDVTLTVSGQLSDGTVFEGTDTIRVIFAGDVNRDGLVNIIDLAMIGKRYGTTTEKPLYHENVDLNSDEAIDIVDMAIAAANYGATTPE